MKRLLFIIFPLIVILTFSVEDIAFICAKTGSVKGYTKYFHFISTSHYSKEYWIEAEARKRFNFTDKDHKWVKIIGTKISLFKKVRIHESAPVIFRSSTFSRKDLRLIYDLNDINTFLKTMLNGTEAEKEEILNKRLLPIN